MSAFNLLGRVANVTTATTVGAVASSSFFDINVTVPLFGGSIAVVAAAAFGAGASLAWGDPIPARSQLFLTILASTVLGVCLSWALSNGMEWKWAQDAPGPAACIAAAIVRLFFPSVVTRVKQLISEFKFSFSRKGEGE